MFKITEPPFILVNMPRKSRVSVNYLKILKNYIRAYQVHLKLILIQFMLKDKKQWVPT